MLARHVHGVAGAAGVRRFDRGGAGHKERPPLVLGALGRLVARRLGVLMGVTSLVTVTAVLGLPHFLKDPFEYDFRKLTRSSTRPRSAAVQPQRRPPVRTLAVADHRPRRRRRRGRADQSGHPPAGRGRARSAAIRSSVRSRPSAICCPGPPEVQQRKLALIAQIRKLTHDPALEVLTTRRGPTWPSRPAATGCTSWRPGTCRPLARRPFTEVDGTDRARGAGLSDRDGALGLERARSARIASVLQYLHLPNGKVIETSGSAVVFGSMIRSILHDGPIATAASLIAVLIIIAFTIRPARSRADGAGHADRWACC